MDNADRGEYRGLMPLRHWLVPLLLLGTYCRPSEPARMAGASPALEGARVVQPRGAAIHPAPGSSTAPIGLEWFDTTTRTVDPRFSDLPARVGEVAAGVPMAGYPDHARAERLKAMPIWAFHHVRDCYNPVQGTRTMFELIQRAASPASYMRYTELDFDTAGQCDQAHFRTPAQAWNHEPDLFEWLFAQVRRRASISRAMDRIAD